MAIHPTAVVSPGVKIGKDVHIGPYSIVEPDCVIGDGCWIDAHVKIGRWTTIGAQTRIYFGALVGDDPQDHRFVPDTPAPTVIGSRTTIREYVTIHRSPFEGRLTSVGDDTLLMAFVHVGHDARIGSRVTAANQTAFSGHVIVEDGAVISGYVLVHQFCRIGALAMVGGRTIIRQDIPPFCMLAENECICGPNVVGLRRAGFDNARRFAIRKAVKTFFFRGLNSANALEEILAENPGNPDISHFADFIRATERGIMPGDPKLKAIGSAADAEEEEE
ncbi:MAG: acyl-ACP--UDP-N-acetylglucosamine O-acyltransferase [Lentisphaeria bacterium]|nr:acyl-ACP--UDP-N-acetylglucosamine O-acyltransferase [Lentisphaeria bacterium]